MRASKLLDVQCCFHSSVHLRWMVDLISDVRLSFKGCKDLWMVGRMMVCLAAWSTCSLPVIFIDIVRLFETERKFVCDSGVSIKSCYGIVSYRELRRKWENGEGLQDGSTTEEWKKYELYKVRRGNCIRILDQLTVKIQCASPIASNASNSLAVCSIYLSVYTMKI